MSDTSVEWPTFQDRLILHSLERDEMKIDTSRAS